MKYFVLFYLLFIAISQLCYSQTSREPPPCTFDALGLHTYCYMCPNVFWWQKPVSLRGRLVLIIVTLTPNPRYKGGSPKYLPLKLMRLVLHAIAIVSSERLCWMTEELGKNINGHKTTPGFWKMSSHSWLVSRALSTTFWVRGLLKVIKFFKTLSLHCTFHVMIWTHRWIARI